MQLSSTYASFEDASLSGTFVLHNQHDDHESPRTPKSRLGIQEKASIASIEDSAMNLAEVVNKFSGLLVQSVVFSPVI